jgi:hypothetical protein
MVAHWNGDPSAVSADLQQLHRRGSPGAFSHQSLTQCRVADERVMPALHVGFADSERGDRRRLRS